MDSDPLGEKPGSAGGTPKGPPRPPIGQEEPEVTSLRRKRPVLVVMSTGREGQPWLAVTPWTCLIKSCNNFCHVEGAVCALVAGELPFAKGNVASSTTSRLVTLGPWLNFFEKRRWQSPLNWELGDSVRFGTVSKDTWHVGRTPHGWRMLSGRNWEPTPTLGDPRSGFSLALLHDLRPVV